MPSASSAPHPSTTASSLSPPAPEPTAKFTPTNSQPLGVATSAPIQGNTDDLAKDSLFGGARKASPPLAPTTALEVGQALEERSGLPTAVPRRGYHEEVYHEEVYHEEIYHEEPGEADVDLGLGDLEATLDGAAEDDCDDLDAMIEAARKEAAGLGLGGGDAGSDEESDEDDIDLT